MTFNELFDDFEVSAFRLETLLQYVVEGEAVDLQAWREGQPQPERSPRTSPWLRRIAETTAAGKSWSRAHVVDLPLSEYLCFEMAGYVQNEQAGERVWIVDRSADPRLGTLREDWWGFDLAAARPVVVLMQYDAKGRFLGWERSEDPALVQRCREQRDLALRYATPLAEFAVHGRV